jgi:hypothetical protein
LSIRANQQRVPKPVKVIVKLGYQMLYRMMTSAA